MEKVKKSLKSVFVIVLVMSFVVTSASYSCQNLQSQELPAPILISPVNNTTWTQDLYPRFQWHAVMGATSYTLQISRSSTDFTSSSLVKEATAYNTLYNIDSALKNCSSYYWRVRAVANNISGIWSNVWKFTVQVAPQEPVLTSPVSGVLTTRRPTFAWEASTGATAYIIEVDESIYTANTTTFTPYSDLSVGLHAWQVRATSCGGGQSSDWSSSATFTIDLNDVVLKDPPNGTTVTTQTPKFEWYPVDGATKYKLEVKKDTIYGTKLFETEVIGTSFTPTAILTPGFYAWHVMSYRNGVWTGVWSSQPFTFTVPIGVPPVKVFLVSPPNGSTDTPKRPTFSWLKLEGATSYWLQVDDNTNFSSPEINQDGITVTSFMALSELDPGEYYWRVNSNATNAQWSDTWSFTIPREVPKQVVLLSPSSGTQDMPPTPIFQWQVLEGAISYTLEVSTNTQFTSLVVEKTGLTRTSWGTASDWDSNDPSQLEDGTYYWRVSSNVENSESAVWSFIVGEPSGEKVAITVNVSNVDGNPIEGATVFVKKDGKTISKVSTGSTGVITIKNLEKGTYTVEVIASGYRMYTEVVDLSSNTTKEITLYKGAVIHGYVYYDDTGNPASNVTVHIYETHTQLQVTSDITDATGYFIVDDVQDNKTYYITIEDYEDQKKQGITPVDVPTSSNALTLVIKTHGEIIGAVQDEKGNLVPGARVTLRDSQDQFVNSTATSNNGSFTFKVTPGRYYVEVAISGFYDYKGSIFTVEYKEIEDLGLITLISMSGELVITVQNTDGDLLDATITVKDVAGNIIDTISVTGGTVSEEVVVGTYTLEAEADGYQSQVVDNISVGSGSTVVQDFILSFAPGSLEIYIEDSEGMSISDAEVFLDGVCMGTTDMTGWLTISDVSPEDHTIHVVREGFADFTHMYTVDPGETLPLEITMERTSKMWLYILLVLIIGAGITVFKYANSISSIILKKKISSPLFCPYCGNRIRKEWKTCLYCGENLEKTRIYDDDTQIY